MNSGPTAYNLACILQLTRIQRKSWPTVCGWETQRLRGSFEMDTTGYLPNFAQEITIFFSVMLCISISTNFMLVSLFLHYLKGLVQKI